jgi:hypothetical protein
MVVITRAIGLYVLIETQISRECHIQLLSEALRTDSKKDRRCNLGTHLYCWVAGSKYM